MGKHKEKEIKTNAMRILEKNKIPYETIQYECEEFIDGLHTAEKTGAPVEQSFKTLVVQGKSKAYYVLVIPIAEEIDLKKAARVLKEKSIEMIKQYPTVIHKSALDYEEIYVSGGRIGTTLKVSPEKLGEAVNAEFEDVIVTA